MLALDTAAWPDLDLIVQHGYMGMGMYLNQNLTPSYARWAAQLGIPLWSFWERWASDPNGGAYQGQIDAEDAVMLARAVGQPLGTAIYMPNDQIVVEWGNTYAYFQAAAQVIINSGYIAGYYGATALWQVLQTYGYKYMIHSSDGTYPPYPGAIIQSFDGVRILPPNVLYLGGVIYDIDFVQSTQFGGWNAAGPWPLPPKIIPEVDMFIRNPRTQEVDYVSGGKRWNIGVHGQGWDDVVASAKAQNLPVPLLVEDYSGSWFKTFDPAS